MPQTSVTRNCSERSWRKLRSGPCGPTALFLIRNSTPIAIHTALPGKFPGEGGASGEESPGARTLARRHPQGQEILLLHSGERTHELALRTDLAYQEAREFRHHYEAAGCSRRF